MKGSMRVHFNIMFALKGERGIGSIKKDKYKKEGELWKCKCLHKAFSIKSLIYKQLAVVMRFFVFIKIPDLFKLSAVRKYILSLSLKLLLD